MLKNVVLIVVLALCEFGCEEGSSTNSYSTASQVEEAVSPIEAMKKSDCFSCHFIHDSSYGPSYLKIAERYESQDVTIRNLGAKVQTGGGGLWGSGLMSRHPFLEDQEVDAMVSWVLSLADQEATLNSMYEEMAGDPITNANDGLHIKVYSDESSLYPKDSTALYANGAEITGYLSRYKIDASALSSSGSFPKIVVATGKLNIKSKGKYFFRLRGKKTGYLYINGQLIISNRESDQEALVELERGEHTIRIENQLRHASDRIVLEWIPPGSEYYTMIPSAHFSRG